MSGSTEAGGHAANPFDKTAAVEPRPLIDRLAGRSRPDLAAKALEQLLATTFPAVSAGRVEALLTEYGLKGEEASALRASTWRKAVARFLREEHYDANARRFLMTLRGPLNIGEDDAIKVERELVWPVYTATLREELSADFILSADLAVLRGFADDLGIGRSKATELLTVEAVAAYRREWSALATHTVNGESVPRRMTRDELKRLQQISTALQITPPADDQIRIENESRLLDMIESGVVPAIPVPINLHKGERCAVASSANWAELRKGKFGNSLETLASGTLYVTDARLIFDSSAKSASIAFDSLLGIERYRDGMLCKKDSGRSPTFLMPEHTAFLVGTLATVAFDAVRNGRKLQIGSSNDSAPASEPKVPERIEPAPQPAREPASAATTARGVDQPRLQKAMAELSALTGLAAVKREVESLVNLARVQAMRMQQGLPTPKMTFHLVFTGRPGTGKTTVARIIGDIFASLGMLSGGQLIETDRSGLVGGYVGQTAIKTADVLRNSLGGFLFIDEAYSLAGRGDNDFGREAIETLLKYMEDHRDGFIVIVAGYREPMNTFLAANPGIRSRFNRFVDFPDYSSGELVEIFSRMATTGGYELTETAIEAARSVFATAAATSGESFGNARLARNVFEGALSEQANRLVGLSTPSREDLCTLTASDIVGPRQPT